ncbi:MAG TPA: hypothetical protein VLM79_22600, partial [Kofleriaceae bacterium]|nr:hypothetical protein [Kofleriaceae bacterium]
MAVRHPRPRGARALGVAIVAATALLAGTLPDRVSRAQPVTDLARAKELYQLAERAMKDGRFDDAARDYGASYELSKDPALFFKIGRANEGAGRCSVAVTYYARYLRDGKPTEQYAATTRERIRACGGDASAGVPPGPDGSAGASGTGSAGGARPDGSASASSDRRPGVADTGSASGAQPRPTAGDGSGAAGGDRGPANGAGSDAGATTDGGVGSGSGEAVPPPPILVPTNKHKVAWVLTGSAIALTALGGILAAAASSSENDVRDLYVGFAGQPATFNAETQKHYDDLVDQGHRFQHLSWASFGLAGAAAAGAAILFVLGGREESAPRGRVTPVVTPSGAGVPPGTDGSAGASGTGSAGGARPDGSASASSDRRPGVSDTGSASGAQPRPTAGDGSGAAGGDRGPANGAGSDAGATTDGGVGS